ncbi:F-box domain-containing protein [Mycena chlorophos]|uniref:F-box domain-containing protein n=1 Tax=Mycena chlorophos TaxID=658473 RepID=A0A8H6SD01_MYCCL|nr:F-box domain-containing protein [Mycena chlorophos]
MRVRLVALGFASLVQRTLGQCADPSLAVPLYRGWNPTTTDHFYTTSAEELGNSTGYSSEGIRAYVYPTTGHQHLRAEVASDESGGYALQNNTPMSIYESQLCGAVPFYRLYSTNFTDHFYTVDSEEMSSALHDTYVFEEIAGYVFASNPVVPPTHSKAGLVAGVTVAAVVVVLLVLALLFVRRRRARKPRILDVLDDLDKPSRASSTGVSEITPFRDAEVDADSMDLPTAAFAADSMPATGSATTLRVVNDPDGTTLLTPAPPPAPSKAAQQRQEQLRNQLEAVQAQLGALERGSQQQQHAGPGPRASDLETQNAALRLRVRELEAQMESQWANGLSDEPPPGYME